jgi:hypothetical protein
MKVSGPELACDGISIGKGQTAASKGSLRNSSVVAHLFHGTNRNPLMGCLRTGIELFPNLKKSLRQIRNNDTESIYVRGFRRQNPWHGSCSHNEKWYESSLCKISYRIVRLADAPSI